MAAIGYGAKCVMYRMPPDQSYREHPEFVGLLETIRTNPADDAPRGIIADWLDDHDQPARAEFIRLQLEAERLRGGGCAVVLGTECDGTKEWCIRCRVVAKANALLAKDWPLWAAPAGGFCDNLYPHKLADNETRVWFTRGFATEVRLPFAQFMGQVKCPACEGAGWVRWATSHGNYDEEPCDKCGEMGSVGDAADIFSEHPIEKVTLTDARIFWSGGNMTCYVGNLGVFPRAEYWRRLEGHTSERSARNALSDVCVDYGRELAGLPKLQRPQ